MTETRPNLTDCNRNRRLQLTGLYDSSVASFTLCPKKDDRKKPVITGCDRFFLPNKSVITYIHHYPILYCTISTICSRPVMRDARCSLAVVFTAGVLCVMGVTSIHYAQVFTVGGWQSG